MKSVFFTTSPLVVCLARNPGSGREAGNLAQRIATTP
jgi:hypothetical protein